MNTQTKLSGAVATLLVFCAAPVPSSAVTVEPNGPFQPAVQHGGDTSNLFVTAAQRGGGGGRGGGARGAGGGGRAAAPNRGGGGGAAAANRGGGGGAAAANRGAGDRQVRSQATSNVNHNRTGNANFNSSNRNINANNVSNRSINNVNVSGDFDGGWNGGWDDDYHPFAAAAVVGGTAALVGSMVNSIPPSCAPTVVNGVTYSNCGGTWYQPQYAGTSVQYQVVNPPQ